MLVIPAVDIQGGRCVRLKQGDFLQETVYSENPCDVARLWQEKGAERIHVVDLDGARRGEPVSREIITAMVKEVIVPIQIGGGIRSLQTIDLYLSAGISRVILGTAALKDEPFFIEACRAFPGAVILGIDARDGLVAVEGWEESSQAFPREIVRRYEGCGLDAIIYTDISRDGMETGINVEATRDLAETVHIPVIASGGVKDINDINILYDARASGIIGVIVGRALYTGALDFVDARAAAEGEASRQSS